MLNFLHYVGYSFIHVKWKYEKYCFQFQSYDNYFKGKYI